MCYFFKSNRHVLLCNTIVDRALILLILRKKHVLLLPINDIFTFQWVTCLCLCRVLWKNFLEGNLMVNLCLRPADGGSSLSPEKIAQASVVVVLGLVFLPPGRRPGFVSWPRGGGDSPPSFCLVVCVSASTQVANSGFESWPWEDSLTAFCRIRIHI